jgi:nucleotide-binding universal stress UspA family protein
VNTIIVPTDFSDHAYHALFYATRLFPAESCKVLLVHSYLEESSRQLSAINPINNQQIQLDLRATIQSRLEAVTSRIKKESPKMNLSIECMYGALPLHQIINDLISNIDVQFVVMGTKGASGLEAVFIGSQAVRVLKEIAATPVFLIPEGAHKQVPDKMVYAVDFKNNLSSKDTALIKKLIYAQNAAMHIVHIHNSTTRENDIAPFYENLKKQLDPINFITNWIASDDAVEEELKQYCNLHNSNMLVLKYHKYGLLKGLLKTSTVEKISFHASIPLLIFPDQEIL